MQFYFHEASKRRKFCSLNPILSIVANIRTNLTSHKIGSKTHYFQSSKIEPCIMNYITLFTSLLNKGLPIFFILADVVETGAKNMQNFSIIC